MKYFLRLRSNGKEKRVIFLNFRQPPNTLHIHSSDRERTWPEAHCNVCNCRTFSTMSLHFRRCKCIHPAAVRIPPTKLKTSAARLSERLQNSQPFPGPVTGLSPARCAGQHSTRTSDLVTLVNIVFKRILLTKARRKDVQKSSDISVYNTINREEVRGI